MRRLAHPAALLALAFALFAAWLHPAVLDPRRIGWLLDGNDRGQNSLGLIAYLRQGHAWPSLHDPLLLAPNGLSVALTDSNPLIALMLKPFAGWLLPAGWQYAGLWLFACMILQVRFAWALAKPFAPDRLSAYAATALLAGTPVLFARFGHINLCAQWLILWALWLFIDRARARGLGGWIAVIALSGLIHPYLFVMVAAVWASAGLRSLVLEPERGATLARIAAGAGVLVAVPVALGYLDEPFASTQSYGAFNMAFDALWNPGNEGYSGLLPAAAASSAQGFEGVNYLGAGLLLLGVLAIVGRIGRQKGAAKDAGLAGLWWLLPAFVVLAAIAIGPQLIWRGQVIASLPLSARWIDLLDPVRASGRMFWPAYYTIVLVILASVLRMPSARTALIVALAIQALDMSQLLASTRELSARAGSDALFYRTPDPRWTTYVEQASAVEVHPYEAYRDLAVLEEVASRAITACRAVPMRYFYASRVPRSIVLRLQDDRRRLEGGEIDPTRFYIFLRELPPPAVAARAIVIDGVAVIPPSRAQPPSSYPYPHCPSRPAAIPADR